MTAPSVRGGEGGGVIRVMLVDDSAVVRGLFTRTLEADPEIQVVSSVGDGKMALNALKRHQIDLVVLDIEMPVMDGLTALPLMLQEQPDLPVLIASNLTLKNAEISMRALRAGAKDYVTKPSTTSELTSGDHFKRELLEKVKGLVGARRSQRRDASFLTKPATADAPAGEDDAAQARHPLFPRAKPGPITLRPPMAETPDMIAIGSSTGGPQALFAVLNNLPKSLYQPILITQHMPGTFTTILAEHVTRVAGRSCREAQDGEVLQSSTIYVAPGDFHMVLDVQAGSGKVLRLLKNPQENFCRPSVDPMLRSLAPIYGRRLLVVMLTGMGQDGMSGSQVVVQNGGTVIAQDEATSVVWGMPGAVATAGLCSAILPLQEIGPHILKVALRSAA